MKLILTALILAICSILFAEEDKTLFTIDGVEVKVSEFEYIYNKNNFDNRADYSRASLEEYLDLYVKFRLKVREAEALNYDKDANLLSELNTYKRQLYESYFDKQVTNKLVDEVLERKKQDVSISHIYIASKSTDSEVKRNSAKELIDEIYGQLQQGAVFEDLAKEKSHDKYSAQQGGYLGYFTGLQIAHYALENAAYNTPIGEYSAPIETSIGYHIVKVNDVRPARGEIKVAIIKKKKDKNTPEKDEQAKKEIFEIYNLLQKGESFETLAKTMSDDKTTAGNGGVLDWIGISQYTQAFEDAAFELENIGDYSKPVELDESWYIIKKIDVKSYDQLIQDKDQLKEEVKKSDRYGIKRSAYFHKILNSYGYTKNEENIAAYKSAVVDRLTGQGMSLEPKENAKEVLSIGDKFFDENDLEKFIARNYRRSKKIDNGEKFDELFDFFIDEKILLYHQDKLAEEDNDYAALLKEYRDGILLFELTEKEIWSKAVEDTSGLKDFFNANRDKFKWNKRAEVELYKVNDDKQLKVGKKLMKKISKIGKDKVFAKMESKGINVANPTLKTFEEGIDKSSIIYTKDEFGAIELDGQDYLYLVKEILPEQQKELKEVRGFVIAAYQEHLEKAWIEKLKAKFHIEVDSAVFNALIKQ